MKKVYLIYAKIKEEDYLSRMIFLLYDKYGFKKGETTNHYIGLYAWTNDKDMVDEFLSARNKDIYYVKPKKMDYDEFEEFRKEHIPEMLKAYTYNILSIENKLTEIKIVSTKNEYESVTMDGEENMYDNTPDFIIDYMVFNDEIIDALDLLGYTIEHDLNWAGDDGRSDYASNMISYGLTLNSHTYISFLNNTAMMLMYIFKPMFV